MTYTYFWVSTHLPQRCINWLGLIVRGLTVWKIWSRHILGIYIHKLSEGVHSNPYFGSQHSLPLQIHRLTKFNSARPQCKSLHHNMACHKMDIVLFCTHLDDICWLQNWWFLQSKVMWYKCIKSVGAVKKLCLCSTFLHQLKLTMSGWKNKFLKNKYSWTTQWFRLFTSAN